MVRKLSNAQSEIVHSLPATMAVFAAPGSGKTTVLTRHILHQLRERNLHPNEITAVTFTRQSAKEMKTRITGELPYVERRNAEALKLGTFHAQIFSMLLQDMPDIPVLLEPREQFQMMRSALQLQRLSDSVDDVRSALTQLTKLHSSWPLKSDRRRRFRRLLRQYNLLKQRNHRWDFDDILIHACELIESGHGSRFVPDLKYLLMDEFQDTNGIQWYILRYLTKLRQANLFVVGDDDQCIYGFRGANPEWLIHFRTWYPSAQFKVLNMNYRSDQAIISASNRLIKHNRNRHPKEIVGASQAKGWTEWMPVPDAASEAREIIARVAAEPLGSTVAVLARTRRQLDVTWASMPRALRNQVEFRTFHDAKGKEWDTVHIAGAVKDVPSPHNKASNEIIHEDIKEEEERRIFYVAMTRARHRLYIYTPRHSKWGGSDPSSFVEEAGLRSHNKSGFCNNKPVER